MPNSVKRSLRNHHEVVEKVGDQVKADEPLFEVSTDKVDTQVPVAVAGVLTEIRGPGGDTIDVGSAVSPSSVTAPAPRLLLPPPRPSPEPAPAPAPAPEAPAPAAPAPAPAALLPLPVAAAPAPAPLRRTTTVCCRRSCAGSWPTTASIVARHRTAAVGITREDVLDFIDSALPQRRSGPGRCGAAVCGSSYAQLLLPPLRRAPVAARLRRRPGSVTLVELSKIRKLTPEHMIMSKATAPCLQCGQRIDFANVDKARGKVKGEWKAAEGFSLTYLPFISRAVIDALAAFPHLNASLSGDDLIVHDYVDLGIAVDIDFQGLSCRSCVSAEGKRLGAIAGDQRPRQPGEDQEDHARRDQRWHLHHHQQRLGRSVLTMAIINQPQVAILSTDAIVRKPVVVDLPDGTESIAIHRSAISRSTWDHRALRRRPSPPLPASR